MFKRYTNTNFQKQKKVQKFQKKNHKMEQYPKMHLAQK